MNTSTTSIRALRIWSFGFLCLPLALTAQQEACDSLDIISVQYAPFVGTDLQVNVANPTMGNFGYPSFSLVNITGDTLAREVINFFGLGQDATAHNMIAIPGAPAATTPFTGTLVLHYFTGNGDLTCSFPITEADLCPPPPCGDMQVYLYAQGGGTPVTTTADWYVTDDMGITEASGVFSIDASGWQQDAQDVCLPPGAHVLHVSQAVAIGTSYAIGVTQDDFVTNGPSEALTPGQSAELTFTFYPACASMITGVDAITAPAPLFTQEGRVIRVTGASARAFGPMGIYDSMGRSVLLVNGYTADMSINLGAYASGIYLLRSLASENRWPTRRFVLP